MYLCVNQPAVDETDVQEIEDGSLISELKGCDAAEAWVDVHPSRQFGQQCNGVLDVPVQIDAVLFIDSAPQSLLAVCLQQVVCHESYQPILQTSALRMGLSECGLLVVPSDKGMRSGSMRNAPQSQARAMLDEGMSPGLDA